MTANSSGSKKKSRNKYCLPFVGNSHPSRVPVYHTAAFHYEGVEDIERVFSLEERSFIYSRGGNPTVNALEDEVAALEKGAAAVAFSSGMGAIAATLMATLKAGDHLVAVDMMYGGSRALISTVLSRFGVECTFIPPAEFVRLSANLKGNTKVVYFETPCNPTLEIISISAVAKLCREKNILVIVDNTMATCEFQKPLEHGADIVIHSLTKYLNGHGDAVAGMAVTKDKSVADTIKFQSMCLLGSCLDPHSAYLVSRGIETLPLRMERHQKNAAKFVKFLRSAPYAREVFFPAISGVARTQMCGVGGVFSFRLKGNDAQICNILRELSLFRLSVSYGDPGWLINYPLRMTHRVFMNDRQSSEFSRLDGLLRISSGLEKCDEAISEFDHVCKNVLGNRKGR